MKKSDQLSYFKDYLYKNLLIVFSLLYFLVSLLLYTFFKIDILIPCLIKSLTGYTCPGCGLTRACLHLLTFDFEAAYQSNKLIFIIIPLLSIYFIKDYYKHIKKER